MMHGAVARSVARSIERAKRARRERWRPGLYESARGRDGPALYIRSSRWRASGAREGVYWALIAVQRRNVQKDKCSS
jgi:hypothetical protein